MNKKIGIVTGGGDCPGLNTVIRAVAKAAAMRGWETLGILGGFDGLLEPRQFRMLDYKALDGLLTRGGTILGTANRGQFSAKTGHGESRRLPKELLDRTQAGMDALGISALVSIGGDGSLSISQQMHEHGIPIIGVPKTIDNDLEGTLLTFGYDSAVACATDALDRLHTTAEKPIVTERRPCEKEPARRQAVANTNNSDTTLIRRAFAALRRCPKPSLSPHLKSK